MDIQTLPVGKLIPADYNPRKDLKPGDPEYEKLKRSLSEFGYVEPVIWNQTTGHVVGGHQRLKVLIDTGVTEVECVVVEISEEKEKALNVALNKISGEWDKEKLPQKHVKKRTWANVYKPEALYNLLFGDATKSIVAVTVSTDFNTALRIKGAANTTKQLTWTFTSGAGDFGIWVGCETESTNYDWGYVYIDDVDISGKLGGTVVSRYISKTLTAGSHTLKITYRKDGSGDVGYDGVQVYAVSIP